MPSAKLHFGEAEVQVRQLASGGRDLALRRCGSGVEWVARIGSAEAWWFAPDDVVNGAGMDARSARGILDFNIRQSSVY